DLGIHRLRPGVLADALDEIGMDVRVAGRGVDRALRIGADDQHLRLVLLEVLAYAADRASGPDRHDDRVDRAAVGLLPDLRAGALVVRARVVHVRVLVGLETAGDLLREP